MIFWNGTQNRSFYGSKEQGTLFLPQQDLLLFSFVFWRKKSTCEFLPTLHDPTLHEFWVFLNTFPWEQCDGSQNSTSSEFFILQQTFVFKTNYVQVFLDVIIFFIVHVIHTCQKIKTLKKKSVLHESFWLKIEQSHLQTLV